jgi:signal transduction histidine kinase
MINVKSIQFRLILWYSSLITVVALAFGAAIYRDIENHLFSTLESTFVRRTQEFSIDILPRIGLDDGETLSHAVNKSYSPEATDRFIRVTSTDGEMIYLSPPPEDHFFDPALVPSARGVLGARLETLGGADGLYIVTSRVPLYDSDVIVEMGGTTTEISLVLGDLRRSLIIGLPLIALTVSAGGYVLVRRSLRPVENLSAKAQEITFGNLNDRLPVAATGDAIEHMSVTLNQMLDRLSEASADASHELRTPLAIIRAELESLVSQTRNLPIDVTARLNSILEETERISFITESLFALSRLDAGEGKAQAVHLDLSALVRSTVDQIRLLADDKHLALSVHADAPVYVLGDSARLKQLLVGLLDNAIKYTSNGGDISLTVRGNGLRALLDITDTGIGISTADLPRVFERFFRADKARSRHVDGAGLGLPIARSICQAHGGSIEIESVEGTGTTCHVRIPLAT